MITDAQFNAWLQNPAAQRVMLFEPRVISNGVAITRYLSNRAYNKTPSTPYLAIVAGGLKVTESISMDSDASLSAGDIEIFNGDGSRDSWLDDVWANGDIPAFLGDVTWDRADFRQVFAGTIIDIGCKARDRLSLQLTNKLERLNTPVTDARLGGNSPTPDAVVPIALGEPHNVTPPSTDPNTLEHAWGGNEQLIEVRTDAAPRSVTTHLDTGRFNFTSAEGGGQVTADVQGIKYNGAYINTVSMLIQYLVTQCGKASTRYTAADLDAAQLAAFEAAHPQAVGLWLADRTNVLAACQQLASSLGAELVPSMTGKLRLIQFAIPTAATIQVLPSQQLERSIQIANRTEVQAAVKLGYCRNYTVQENIGTSLPPQHKALYAQEWLTVTSVDIGVQATYKLDAEPVQKDTCLVHAADAQTEADRLLAIVKVPRTTFRVDVLPVHLFTELGSSVMLFNSRFGLKAGKPGLVTSRTVDFETLRITMEITV